MDNSQQFEKIIIVNSIILPDEVKKYLKDKYGYTCDSEHAFLQVVNDGNELSQWLERVGYKFKNKQPKSDLIALYANNSNERIINK